MSWASPPVRIIADDLTGAVDCLAPLVSTVDPGLVLLYPGPALAGRRALAWDACTRDATDREAERRLSGLAARLTRGLYAAEGESAAPAPLLIQKIDSRGRGAIARDLSILLQGLARLPLAVVCPALPAQGRYFRDGITRDTSTGGADVDLAAQVRAVGHRIYLGRGRTPHEIRADIDAALASGARVLLSDGSDTAQMRALASAITAPGAPPLLAVVSSGLTTALAELAGTGRAQSPALPRVPRLTFVLGTAAEATRRQAAELGRARGIPIHVRTPGQWLEEPLPEAPGDVIWALPLAAESHLSLDPVAGMVRALMPRLREAGALMLSGGDTARAVLASLGLDRFEVLGAVEPGLCRCQGPGIDLFTKSGGFGDDNTLIRLYDRLRNEESFA